MFRKILSLIFIFSLSVNVFSLPVIPTRLDSVVVPVKVISGSGVNWSGKVNYWLWIGDNDSLNISLQINPVGNAPACNITKTEGDVGTIQHANGINGKREIFFECSFTTPPAPTDKYTATVTINADQSDMEKTARAILAEVPNSEKCKFLGGIGCFMIGGVGPSINAGKYGMLQGFHMCDGPLGVNMRDANHVECATLYPSEAATANAFDTSLIYRIGKAIAREAKTASPMCGTYNIKYDNVLLAPMLNMVRDPRFGRAFETWGEDPYLMGRLATVAVKGMQSEGIITTPKHFACNDQELYRETSSSEVGDTTLRQTYLYPFEMVIREAKPWGLMAAYNKVNGTLCTENQYLLSKIAKGEWGFRGFILSDWYTWMQKPAVNSGLDIEMDLLTVFKDICDGSVPWDTVDRKVLNSLRGMVWTGCINDFKKFESLPEYKNTQEQIELAAEAARKSLVLVKNDSVVVGAAKQPPLLPLNKNNITSVAVVGPYANIMRIGAECPGTSARVDPCQNVIKTPLQAIQQKIGAAKVTTNWNAADIVIVFVGIPSTGDNAACEGHDRPSVNLPDAEDGTKQDTLVKQILLAGKKTIVVLTGGAAVSDGYWSKAHSVLVAFYPGQGQADAIADVLFGDYNPSGKLSVTFPKSASDLPEYTSAGAAEKKYKYESPEEGRGYPYYLKSGKQPLWWFGWGLHYCTFTYSNLQAPRCAAIGSKVKVSVDVKNNGPMAGEEIVQLYLSQKSPVVARPVKQLRGFARVSLNAGETKTVTFELKEWDFAHWTAAHGWYVDPNSTFEICVGQYANDPKSLISYITMDPATGVCQ